MPREQVKLEQRDNMVGLPGSLFNVHVFADEFTDLRGYEVWISITGGTSGSLTVEDIDIDDQRPDYVFSGQTTYDAFVLADAKMLSELEAGGVSATTPKYLATFALRASLNAQGVFTVEAIEGDGKTGTLAADSGNQSMTVNVLNSTSITVSKYGWE